MNDPQNAATEEVRTHEDSVLKIHEAAAKAREVESLHGKKKAIRPRHEWLLIRRHQKVDKISDGGIVLAENSESSIGIVVAKSPKVLDLEVGARVIFTNFALTIKDLNEVTGDKELYLVRDEECYSEIIDAPEETPVEGD